LTSLAGRLQAPAVEAAIVAAALSQLAVGN